jgi:MFS family permease
VIDTAAPAVTSDHARFKGWHVVGGSFFILFVSSGLGFYALAVYLDALTDEKGFSVGQVSFANFLFFFTSGLAGLLAARLIARHDLRLVMAGGAVIAGLSLGLVGFADSLWQLCVLYTVFALGWSGCGLIPATTVVTRWFHRRRSLALSIASTGLSVGGILITPVVKKLLEDYGLEATMPWLGLVFAVAIVPAAFRLMTPSPGLVGQFPDGDPAPIAGSVVEGVDFHTAARSRYFLCITFAYVALMAAQVGGISHLVKLASDRIDKPTAALVLSVMAAASVAARLAGGVIASRVPMTGFTACLAALQGVALLSLSWVGTTTGMLLVAVLFGMTVGNLLMLQPLMMAEAFGVKDYARIYSRSQFVSMFGVAFGPLVLGIVHDSVDGYAFPYVLAGTLSIVGTLLVLAAGSTSTAAQRAEATVRPGGVTPAEVPA